MKQYITILFTLLTLGVVAQKTDTTMQTQPKFNLLEGNAKTAKDTCLFFIDLANPRTDDYVGLVFTGSFDDFLAGMLYTRCDCARKPAKPKPTESFIGAASYFNSLRIKKDTDLASYETIWLGNSLKYLYKRK